MNGTSPNLAIYTVTTIGYVENPPIPMPNPIFGAGEQWWWMPHDLIGDICGRGPLR